ncbi:hypothetical protein M501DRAFT_1019216 [Patellaria atrata CBS 101060]|uniref:FAD dependent oxidoreductase domain-containing protein n=1 Tax=Patellaria atrata CBS 101060 TaxID=1346257 RepID=A0A9P4S6K7_9PEZI|nr:hypothetical protein M501DRAFT_1019216 [Patellaria atrata CBS 101060]
MTGLLRIVQRIFQVRDSSPSLRESSSSIILGAGVIGLSTAYYLAVAQHDPGASYNKKNRVITVVERCSRIAAGASSQCEGVLGEFGFDEVEPLARLSIDLYARMAKAYNETGKLGFSKLKTYVIFSDGYDPNNSQLIFLVEEQEDLSMLPSWLTVPSDWQTGFRELESAKRIATSPDDVKIDSKVIHESKSLTSDYIKYTPDKNLEIIASGRAYMPKTTTGIPIITELLWNGIFGDAGPTHASGVFLNLGHHLDGFTLGLSSGKVMNELVFGQKTSVDVTPSGFPKPNNDLEHYVE